jgi:hypothetical protein
MEALHQTQLNSFMLGKIKFVLIFSTLFLSSMVFADGGLAKEETRYIKGINSCAV